MAATEKALSKLHAKLAEVMSEALDGTVIEGYEDPETGEIVGATKIPPSASILTVAAKFLKDNEITCDVEQNDQLAALREKLDRQKSRVSGNEPLLTPEDVADVHDNAAFIGRA